jgi:arginine deiminase
MVHHPDLAHERLSPHDCHELLFDESSAAAAAAATA